MLTAEVCGGGGGGERASGQAEERISTRGEGEKREEKEHNNASVGQHIECCGRISCCNGPAACRPGVRSWEKGCARGRKSRDSVARSVVYGEVARLRVCRNRLR